MQGVAVSMSAAQFLTDTCAKYPGRVTVLALAPLTNVALAMQLDPQFATNMVSTLVHLDVALKSR